MRGDLLFYSGSDLPSRVVEAAEVHEGAQEPTPTRVGWVPSHVAIQIGGTLDVPVVIEAIWPQVLRDTHPGGQLVSWASRYPQHRRDRALAWVQEQTARHYSAADILSNLTRVLKVDLGVFDRGTFDCSHLAFSYMSLAGEDWVGSGYPGAADWVANPQVVTPADLWDYTQFVLAHPPVS